ncbi:hypothetical protein, partial [Synechococcus sp. CS-205]|uniref:hypothetical protein n=1 Tax=Synechococcus sp. CS-205 TaxID=2847984 RepID=UPI00223B9583
MKKAPVTRGLDENLCSDFTADPIHGAGPYSPGRWPLERLPMLAGLRPLLPGGPDKRPLVGDAWPDHPGLTMPELQRLSPACICWHIGASPDHIAVDLDGPRPIAFCQQHGCDPRTVDTWRIERVNNRDRLKVVFLVTPEQKAILSAGSKTVRVGAGELGPDDPGEELAIFGKHGSQIVVLGDHYDKETGYPFRGRDAESQHCGCHGHQARQQICSADTSGAGSAAQSLGSSEGIS